MAKPADISSKRLISLNPDGWARWVTQQADIHVQELISGEFQFISRENDALMRVTSHQDGEFLLLNEVQLRYTEAMPRRIRAYAALAEEKYATPVYPVLVNILPPAAGVTIVHRYQQTFKGLESRQDYRVINLWEVEAEAVFRASLISLLPLIPVMRGGDSEQMVTRALRELRVTRQAGELETVLALFASFVLDVKLIQQIMRWDMSIIRESPWFQEATAQGMEIGLQKGVQQGMQQGTQAVALRLLAHRFGTLAPELEQRVRALSLEELESLTELLLDVHDLTEVTAWLDTVSGEHDVQN